MTSPTVQKNRKSKIMIEKPPDQTRIRHTGNAAIDLQRHITRLRAQEVRWPDVGARLKISARQAQRLYKAATESGMVQGDFEQWTISHSFRNSDPPEMVSYLLRLMRDVTAENFAPYIDKITASWIWYLHTAFPEIEPHQILRFAQRYVDIEFDSKRASEKPELDKSLITENDDEWDFKNLEAEQSTKNSPIGTT